MNIPHPSLSLNHHLICHISGLYMSPSTHTYMTRRCRLVPPTSQIRSPDHSSPQQIHPTSYVVLKPSLLPISITTPSNPLLSSMFFTKMMHHVSPHSLQQNFYISTTSDYKLMGGGATDQLRTTETEYIHIGRSHHII